MCYNRGMTYDPNAKRLKVVVVLPAYNAAQTLRQTVADIDRRVADEIILVDDASQDNTVAIARELGLTVHVHEKNRGYGGNQKTCYKLALEHGADIVVMVHPDYQYDPKLIGYFVRFIKGGYFDIMLGSRVRSRREALEGGMPRYKYYANRILTFCQNVSTGYNLTEWHTGMRAYRREVLEKIDTTHYSDDFIFDGQFLMKAVRRGFRVGEIPVPVRYFKEASSINLLRSIKYGLGILMLCIIK